jgi:uncharacterized protein YdhG (YjbR/CyaY superfamily)
MVAHQTVDAYIAGFPAEIAAILTAVRETIRDTAPTATETIKYGMAAYLIGKDPVIYLAGWKHHAGLYPVHSQSPEIEAAIAPLRAAKDTLQLKYNKPIPHDLIAAIVAGRVARLQSGA